MRATTCAFIGALTLAVAVAGVAAADNMQGMSMSGAPAAKRGQGAGVITALDARAGTLTIKHGAIPGVGWPAMTMTFKAKPATLLKGLRVGEAISFDCIVQGQSATVTAVRPK